MQDVARARMESIKTPIFVQGRNSDELQGIFEAICGGAKEASARAKEPRAT